MDSAQIAKEALDEHRKLDREVEVLRLRLAAPCGGSTQDWFLHCYEHFRHFHTQLRKHMEMEEYGGFLKQVRERRPTLDVSVKRLQIAHRTMRKSCNYIEDFLDLCLEDPAPEDASKARRLIDDLLDDLHRHEVAENRLVQEVFTQDIGAGD